MGHSKQLNNERLTSVIVTPQSRDGCAFVRFFNDSGKPDFSLRLEDSEIAGPEIVSR